MDLKKPTPVERAKRLKNAIERKRAGVDQKPRAAKRAKERKKPRMSKRAIGNEKPNQEKLASVQ